MLHNKSLQVTVVKVVNSSVLHLAVSFILNIEMPIAFVFM